MRFPIEVAVAWFAEDTRRLFSIARYLAIDSNLPSLEGWHLFLSAARMDRSTTCQVMPEEARRLLAEAPLASENQTKPDLHRFMKISPILKEACCSVAEYSRPIRPSELLTQIFVSDNEAREKLSSILGKEILKHLRNTILLVKFDPDELGKLLLLKKDLPERYE